MNTFERLYLSAPKYTKAIQQDSSPRKRRQSLNNPESGGDFRAILRGSNTATVLVWFILSIRVLCDNVINLCGFFDGWYFFLNPFLNTFLDLFCCVIFFIRCLCFVGGARWLQRRHRESLASKLPHQSKYNIIQIPCFVRMGKERRECTDAIVVRRTVDNEEEEEEEEATGTLCWGYLGQ